MKEEFRPIPDYEGIYEISNFGRVKSFKCNKERILKAVLNPRGYLHVSLYKDNKQKSYQVHQLVAIVFLGHTPCGMDLVVDHIDDNKTNNRVDNLQIITQHDNTNKYGTSKYKGIAFNKRDNKWMAYYKCPIKKKQLHIGYYFTEAEAVKARKQWMSKNLLKDKVKESYIQLKFDF